MRWTPEDIATVILENGPFPRELVESWPETLRKDYLELMAFDLDELGVEEFVRRRRFLGETYLMSHDTPVGASTLLRTAWSILTDGEPPPELPRFDIV